jgi:probable HAF family extracellular repeat protein
MRTFSAFSASDVTGRWQTVFEENMPMKSLPGPQPQYSIIDLGALEGGTISEAVALNNRNQVVGWSNLGSVLQDGRRIDKSSFRHGFVWSEGRLRDLNPRDGIDIRLPRGINEAGMVVGNLFPLGGTSRSFCVQADGTEAQGMPRTMYRAEAINGNGCIAGAVTDEADMVQTAMLCPDRGPEAAGEFRRMRLEAGLVGGSVRALNDRNEGVGFAMWGQPSSQEVKQAVLWRADGLGRALFIGEEATAASMATGINSVGAVVGYRETPARLQGATRVAFLRTAQGAIVHLPALPSAKQSEACGINARGQVVGLSGQRAFLWTPESGILDLNDCLSADTGWTLTRANAINAGGAIVGQGIFQGRRQAFLALPATPGERPGWL